ncbi:hypothetical protein D9757_000948 [Collybiopsis confluens]|uniref:NmrA-like domain-containing protein n=1 Tax=Collybiopsis confluens TaxID=2823264 RepID=A0A8H5I010_9AGAR|nr:hypothetical protein D9757_000948 [Collybiopsis confluens]
MSSSSQKKLILVIGATGMQGRPTVASLLASRPDGTPSPYAVRALTRDPTSKQAQELKLLGAELFKGRFDDLESITAALKDCYGIFVNTDTFTVGAEAEMFYAIKIFEEARKSPQLRHFVWGGLDYGSKIGEFDPRFRTVHHDSKGAVGDFLKMQPSSMGDSLAWSILTTGPYMENLGGILLGPLPKRDSNGNVVFAVPTGNGHIPAVCLEDVGWWVRYTFDHRAETSGQELKIATEFMTGDQLVETFTRVTGIPAIRKKMSVEEYVALYKPILDRSIVKGQPGPSIGETYSAMWRIYTEDLFKRDMDWIRRTHPTGYTLESWIRTKGYDGTLGPDYRFFKPKAAKIPKARL